MISNEEFKRLCEIDDKMLNDKEVTREELRERTNIIKKFKHEVERAYLKYEKII